MQSKLQLKELHRILLSEKQAFDQLLLLLKKEKTALEQQSIEKLADYSHKKKQITQNMEELSISRNQYLSNSGLNISDSVALSNTLQKLPSELQALWQQILVLAENCHRNNQINGKIIQMSKSRVERSLRLIKSQTGDPGLTYTAKGHATLSSSRVKAIQA